jgi:3-hydroxybutyryl-CoA dehydrogenase
MEIKKIAVMGAGAMGHGIAQVCAQAGFQVALEDVKMEYALRGVEAIRKFLQGSVERKKMTPDEANTVLSRIKPTADLAEAVNDADLVIEAIVEDMDIKKNAFKQLDHVSPGHTIFASNTSYLCVTEIAASTKRSDRFVGMHWFNPPQIMRGVEIVRTHKTSPEVIETMVNLTKKLGKEPAVCQDAPGFIANRLLQIWRAESFKLVDEGAAAFEDVDKALKTAYSFRMGPFELADMIGLAISLKGSETFFSELRREIFRPSRSLIMKVRAGDDGRKTGQGFYTYKQS